MTKACDHLGIEPTEVIAFGEAENDIAMFRLAGESVAMGQAGADIKLAADHTTATNTKDGVAEFIEKRLL